MAGDLVRFKKRFYSHRSLWPIEMPPVVCEDDFTCREKESVYFGYRKMIFQLSWDWRIYWIRATLQLHVLQFIQRNINRLTYRKYYKAYWIDSRRFLTTQSSPHLIDFAQRITTLNKGGSLASCDNLKQSPILIKLGETNIVDKYKYPKANAYHIMRLFNIRLSVSCCIFIEARLYGMLRLGSTQVIDICWPMLHSTHIVIYMTQLCSNQPPLRHTHR